MTAGAVAAPLIIPIMHLQTHGTKNHIDTSTHICMHSDTPGVLIFYTLDGSWPTPLQRGGASRASRKYIQPILLPAGRVAVRAVASTSDGRESATVTKIFSVLPASGAEPDVSQPGVEGGRGSVVPVVPAGSDRVPAGSPEADRTSSPQKGPGSPQQQLKQLSSTETTRVQKETDFLRCSQCLSLRPSDPLAGFCSQCGSAVPPLPDRRLAPAEGGQMVSCVFCNSVVPVNTQTCLICETSLGQQLLPQSSLRLQDPVVCVCCGRRNPAHIDSCLTCESNLHPAGCVADSAPSVPSAECRASSCSRCKRVNRADARFCDWCGYKPQRAGGCWRCGGRGRVDALYCASCGVRLEAPAPPTSSDVIRPAEKIVASKQATPSSDPVRSVMLAPPTTDRHTQTVGLYYPSATELHRKEQQRALQLSRRQETRQQTPLSAVSPGRGYWRKQLDHVCAHLRSYTHNNAPFRALLGEPRLGRVTSAVIREDTHEVSLTLSFVLAAANQKQVGAECGAVSPAGQADSLSSVTERATRKNRPPEKSLPQEMTSDPPLVSDSQLLEELGPGSGRGRLNVVQQLLDQGADPRRCGGSNRHALAVAVISGHHHVLPILVQRGADINQQSGQMKNTALHDAAALGSAGIQSATFLLSCDAGVTQRNAAGETAYDVAVRSDCSSMVSLLASHTGRRLLGRLGKPNLDLV